MVSPRSHQNGLVGSQRHCQSGFIANTEANLFRFLYDPQDLLEEVWSFPNKLDDAQIPNRAQHRALNLPDSQKA